MIDRLTVIEDRYEDLGRQLMEVGADYQRAAGINKERSDLEPVVMKAREYTQALKNLQEARGILASESDPDLRALAEVDVQQLTPRIDALEKEIKRLLVPRDPRDEKNVIVEIRAGTGGDEAALFAADLFRMYTRFAEKQGTRIYR